MAGIAAGAEAAEDLEEALDVAGGEARRRLVEEQDAARSVGDRARDLDELERRRRQLTRGRVGIDRALAGERVEHLDRSPPHRRGVDDAALRGERGEHHVLGDAEVRADRELLMDHRDAGLARLERRARRVAARRRG